MTSPCARIQGNDQIRKYYLKIIMTYYFDPLRPGEGLRSAIDVILDTLSVNKLRHNVRKSVLHTDTKHRNQEPVPLATVPKNEQTQRQCFVEKYP